MFKVRFRFREMFKIKFYMNIYVDPGTHLTQQNQDVQDVQHF